MNWKDLLIGLAVSRVSNGQRYYRHYQTIQTLNKARREYERQRKKGKSAVDALKKVAMDTGIPQRELAEFLKDKTGDFGDLPIGDILEGTIYGSKN